MITSTSSDVPPAVGVQSTQPTFPGRFLAEGHPIELVLLPERQVILDDQVVLTIAGDDVQRRRHRQQVRPNRLREPSDRRRVCRRRELVDTERAGEERPEIAFPSDRHASGACGRLARRRLADDDIQTCAVDVRVLGTRVVDIHPHGSQYPLDRAPDFVVGGYVSIQALREHDGTGLRRRIGRVLADALVGIRVTPVHHQGDTGDDSHQPQRE